MSGPTVKEIRDGRAAEAQEWRKIARQLADAGEVFSSVEIWAQVRPANATRSTARYFYASIHDALMPLLLAGVLDTKRAPPPKRGIARRLYWRPQ